MVVVHVKAGAEEEEEPQLQLQAEFLYECSSSSAVDDVAESIADIHRLQSKILHSLSPFVRTRLLPRAFPGAAESHRDPALVALERAVSEAESYASKVLRNRFLSPRALRDHITSIERALVLAQQEAPPGFDFQSLSEHQLHDRMRLWWAGKELASGKRLCDYIGPNEKTKIIVRLKPASTEA
ncbi:UPF0769 protein C21orf59 homolog isoform X2 [Ananas comosus]|uniref:UPF0769 protein C21orf59 homolog isoform X2 n=1 Tax=Ananas comosus TaxID=4615 RepID=A0A6P5EQT1_ANACO|nr:UPF0769 protein C21orf59 homolog isoform X2 [Ananas comosus]